MRTTYDKKINANTLSTDVDTYIFSERVSKREREKHP